MASISLFFSSSILLFFMLVTASASEYVPSDSLKKPEDVYVSKPNSEIPKKSSHEYVANPKSDTLKEHNDIYVPESESETPKRPDNVYIPKPDSNDVYIPKPKSQTLKKPGDIVPKPESETSKKPSDEYVPKFKSEVPKNTNDEHELQPDSLPIAIEGLVLCKSGSKYIPIKGAVARITCSISGHEEEYDAAPFSCLTSETDEKGYFFKTLGNLGFEKMLRLKDCKVKLEKSPLKSCSIPTNVNRGITGALLSSYQILHDKKIKLYPVGPFFFTSHRDIPSYAQSTPTPTGY